MLSLKNSGSSKGFLDSLQRAQKASRDSVTILKRYGERGVAALAAATPSDTGKTAQSWGYRIVRRRQAAVLEFYNTNSADGTPVAILLQYGHGTRQGGYVQGRDYINPATQPIFDELATALWKEMSS